MTPFCTDIEAMLEYIMQPPYLNNICVNSTGVIVIQDDDDDDYSNADENI